MPADDRNSHTLFLKNLAKIILSDITFSFMRKIKKHKHFSKKVNLDTASIAVFLCLIIGYIFNDLYF